MHRIPHRVAAAVIAAVLLLAPVAAQAAPADGSTAAGWAAGFLAAVETAVHDTWNRLAAAVADDEAGPDEGSAAIAVEDDDGNELQPAFDPDGSN